MRLRESTAVGVPGVWGTRLMQAHNAQRAHATTPPGRRNDNSDALLSHWQHSLFQQGAMAEPSWQPQDFWHARLALG
jgi:hypothetical protein